MVAKPLSLPYREDERVMWKVKHARTADCVVAGFRVHKDGEGVGSLLLGLYDDEGTLHHVGVASSFTVARRKELTEELAPYRADALDGHPWAAWAEAEAEAMAKGRPDARRAEPLERRPEHELGAAPAGAGGRGGLRPPPGRPVPPRHVVRPLAARARARVVHLQPARQRPSPRSWKRSFAPETLALGALWAETAGHDGFRPRPARSSCPPQPATARRELARLLADARWNGDVDGVVLAVHEAMVNAQRHGGGVTRATAGFEGRQGRRRDRPTAARASSSRSPAMADITAERGRGLFLIRQLAADAFVVRAGRRRPSWSSSSSGDPQGRTGRCLCYVEQAVPGRRSWPRREGRAARRKTSSSSTSTTSGSTPC